MLSIFLSEGHLLVIAIRLASEETRRVQRDITMKIEPCRIEITRDNTI